MSTLKHLNLTEKDFSLMIDGLDCLPNKDQVGDMMSTLFIGLLSKDDPEARLKMETERDKEKSKKKHEKEMLAEEIKILQGKLLMLKRYLMEQGAINETVDIINHVG